jgi:quinoprotein glucose dehydrogenase
MGQPYNSAATVYKNLLILGTNGSPGSVRAFDARTGKKAWEFFGVPKPGDVGIDSWENESWRNREGVENWGFSQTLDAERGILYVTFEAPGPLDFYGGDRAGNGLFGNSLVALDAQTGEYRWHFQAVHHDLWDYDSPAPPVLIDVTVGGERVPALALVGKIAYMFILNRVTGKPLFGVEERRVPGSNVPGEKPSPTQPFPLKPPPIARDRFSLSDLVTADDTTPEHAAYCRSLADKLELLNEGPYTPYTYKSSGPKPRVTVIFPGSIGGPNWGGLAADPNLGYVFVNTSDVATTGWVQETPPGTRVPFSRQTLMDGSTTKFQWNARDPRKMGGELGWPCQRPPWGQLIAVNAATGEFAWKVPLGITEQLPPGKQNTGRVNMGGPIATAGGLLFVGATNDHRFRAFDTRTGKELWTTTLPTSAHTIPITYQGKDGRQYVAIVAAGDSALDDEPAPGSEALIAYALPK